MRIVNEAGGVAGHSNIRPGAILNHHAFLDDQDGMQDLDDLIPPDDRAAFAVAGAWAINHAGEIASVAKCEADGIHVAGELLNVR